LQSPGQICVREVTRRSANPDVETETAQQADVGRFDIEGGPQPLGV
jgi:hypothetical protein